LARPASPQPFLQASLRASVQVLLRSQASSPERPTDPTRRPERRTGNSSRRGTIFATPRASSRIVDVAALRASLKSFWIASKIGRSSRSIVTAGPARVSERRATRDVGRRHPCFLPARRLLQVHLLVGLHAEKPGKAIWNSHAFGNAGAARCLLEVQECVLAGEVQTRAMFG